MVIPSPFQSQIYRARDLSRGEPIPDGAGSLERFLALTQGLITQVSGSGALSLVLLAAAELQRREERPPVYIAASSGTFFPPDAEAMGLSLDLFPVLRARDELQTAGMIDTVLRSRLVSAVIADIPGGYRFDLSRLSRFLHVVRGSGARLFFLQERRTALMSSSVSLQLEASVTDGAVVVRAERRRDPFPELRIAIDAGVY